MPLVLRSLFAKPHPSMDSRLENLLPLFQISLVSWKLGKIIVFMTPRYPCWVHKAVKRQTCLYAGLQCNYSLTAYPYFFSPFILHMEPNIDADFSIIGPPVKHNYYLRILIFQYYIFLQVCKTVIPVFSSFKFQC